MKYDPTLLEAALVGYAFELARIDEKIAEIKEKLGENTNPDPGAKVKKRHISPEGRARIAAAQKKRWRKAKRAARLAAAR